MTSGSNYITDSNTYGKTGHFGNSDEPSDYAGPGDVAFTSTGIVILIRMVMIPTVTG